ncbi:MAG: hypothetical protein HY617_01790 [Candidatus Sungbacteria bacterium]|nr:hypothetical protein [Candidatus Sungbacteria bacterium]
MESAKGTLEQRALELFRKGKEESEVICILQEEGSDFQAAFRAAWNGRVRFSRERICTAADFYVRAFRGLLPLQEASDSVEHIQLDFNEWADAIEIALRVADKKVATLAEALQQLCDEIMDDAMEQLRQDREKDDYEDPECE